MLKCTKMITLAVAPSVWVLRHCVSLPGGGSLGIVVSFNETSSVLALGTLFSSSAKQKNRQDKDKLISAQNTKCVAGDTKQCHFTCF